MAIPFLLERKESPMGKSENQIPFLLDKESPEKSLLEKQEGQIPFLLKPEDIKAIPTEISTLEVPKKLPTETIAPYQKSITEKITELPSKIKKEVQYVGERGIEDIETIVKGLPEAGLGLAKVMSLPEAERNVALGNMAVELTKAQWERWKAIVKHPITELRERPVLTALDIALPLTAFKVAGTVGLLGKAGTLESIPAIGKVAQRYLGRPFSYEPELQTLFRQTAGKVTLGRQAGIKEAERLFKGFSPAERLRVGQIIKGGITTEPKFVEAVKPVKELRETLASQLRERGLLGEETFLTKLPQKTVSELNKSRELLDERLTTLQELRDTPVANRTKLLDRINTLNRLKTKNKIELNRIKSSKEIIDTEKFWLGKYRESAIEGLDDEIKNIRADILAKRPYKGLASDIQKLEGKVEELDTRLFHHYHYGGWMEYMPREYLKHIENKGKLLQWLSPKTYRIRTPWQKGRTDIPEEVRMAMGEVLEPSYPMYMAITRESRAIATYDLFQDVAKNPKWASAKPVENWVRISESERIPALGDLAGKYVRPDVAEEINGFSRMLTPGQQVYQKWLSLWKFGKVVPRVGTHLRNIYNDFVFLDFAGLSPVNPKTYPLLVDALKDIRASGRVSQKLIKDGLLETEYAGTEIIPLFTRWLSKAGKEGNLFNDFADVVKSGVNKASEIYKMEDQVFKVATAMHWEKKVGWGRALEEVDRWFPNYREVPKVTKFLRQYPLGAPFFSFKSEALRIAKNAAIHHPLKLAKWAMMPSLITDTSARMIGMSDEEVNKWRNSLPDWAKKGMYAVVPSDKNNPRAIDLTYVLFLGDLSEGVDPRTIASNPVFTIPYAAFSNRELFSDKKITRPGFTTQETMKAWTEKLIRDLAPTFMLIPGSTDYEKMRKALLKKPEAITGKPPSIPWTLLDVFGGLRTRTFGEEKERMKSFYLGKKGSMKDLVSEIYYTVNRKDLTPEQKRDKIKQLQEAIKKVGKKKIGVD